MFESNSVRDPNKMCPNFTPKKASQKFGVERKTASRPTLSLYEINPYSEIGNQKAGFMVSGFLALALFESQINLKKCGYFEKPF